MLQKHRSKKSNAMNTWWNLKIKFKIYDIE